jgi:hypothetical protein
MCRKMTISLTPTPNFAQFLFELLTLNGTSNISFISWRPVLVVEEARENHRPWESNW